MPNLKSSAGKVGKKVTQVIIFTSGLTKTYHGIYSDTVEEGKMVKFKTDSIPLVMVNSKEVAIVEVFEE